MQANPVGPTSSPMVTDEHSASSVLRIDDIRLDQLMRWHGTDESNLPPAHTLQNLSRDTVAALAELREARRTIEQLREARQTIAQLREARQTIAQLRAAMGRAFLATRFPEVHAILLDALGPPPDDDGAPPEAS